MTTSLIQCKNNEISIYLEDNLSPEIIKKELKKIQKAFPAIPPEYHAILHERLIANNFNQQRLIDAINNVIDTCKYQVPAIAEIISFDKRIKLKSYDDVRKELDFNDKAMKKDNKKIKINGVAYWVSTYDYINYKLNVYDYEK